MSARARGAMTLALDVGGTGLKGAVLDEKGRMRSERVRVKTPRPCTPSVLVDALAGIASELPRFDRVSVGFPGVVRDGRVITAPNLGTESFRGFDLARALAKRVERPVRVLNDADMQGYGAVRGRGVEMVVTLGTGFGTALFMDGTLCPHLELAHHDFRDGQTYEEQLGEKARKKAGKKRWQRRVLRAIDTLRELVNFDHLYLGGGNAKRLDAELPPDVSIVDNAAGILGGIRLWEKRGRDSIKRPGAK